jgi:iron complex outermembrane receptor protein
MTPQLVTKLLYAFRPPFTRELYTNNIRQLGNLNLKPEVINTIELAGSYVQGKQLQLNYDLYYYSTEDRIIIAPISTDKGEYQNAGKKTGYGFSIESSWLLNPRWKFTGNYSFQSAEDEKGHWLPDAPHHELYFRADWKFLPEWELTGQVNWVGRRYRMYNDSRPPIDDYAILDLNTRYRPKKSSWELGLLVRNILDTDAREPMSPKLPNDLPLPGRSIALEVRYQF